MNKYKETFTTWNKVAELYQEKFMDLTLYNDSYDLFCNELKKQNSGVLEIGCGPGNISKYLLSKRNDLKITGIDIAPAMIKLAKVNNPAAEFFELDIRSLNQIEKRFEGIIGGFCLPYLSGDDCLKLFNDCRNLLSDDGILYLSYIEGDGKSDYLTGSSGHRTYFYDHQLHNIKDQLKEHDFEIARTLQKDFNNNGTDEVHTILIAKKTA